MAILGQLSWFCSLPAPCLLAPDPSLSGHCKKLKNRNVLASVCITGQQQLKCWCIINVVFLLKSKHSIFTLDAMKKKNQLCPTWNKENTTGPTPALCKDFSCFFFFTFLVYTVYMGTWALMFFSSRSVMKVCFIQHCVLAFCLYFVTQCILWSLPMAATGALQGAWKLTDTLWWLL